MSLRDVCKAYGGLTAIDKDGNKTEYLWDYKNDKPFKVENKSKILNRKKNARRKEGEIKP